MYGVLQTNQKQAADIFAEGGDKKAYFVRAVYDCSVWESEHWSRKAQDEFTEMQSLQPTPPLSVQKGDIMETLGEFNIGSNSKLLKVRHVTNGRIGYLPRVHVVIDYERHSSQTHILQVNRSTYESTAETAVAQSNNLPFELLDVILQKSFLRFSLSEELEFNCPNNEDISFALSSVDDCWFRRIRKQRFKKTTYRRMSVFLREVKVTPAIIRNNRKYLEENINPTKEFIESLWSADCVTEVESNSILREEKDRDRNGELLYLMRSFTDRKYSAAGKCLRQTNQKQIEQLLERGGVVLKAKIRFPEKTKGKLGHEILEPFNAAAVHDLEIVGITKGSVWIWCKSQNAFKRLQEMNESSDCSHNLSTLIRHLSSGKINPTDVRLRSRQFKRKTVVCRQNKINFTRRLKLLNIKESVYGVTKLRDAIHILCRFDFPSPSDRNSVLVFEDRNPFRLLNKIEIGEMKRPEHIGSSETENCLYIADSYEDKDKDEDNGCVWKILGETGHQVTHWLLDVGMIVVLSVSSGGQLLMTRWGDPSYSLLIYGPDAELRLSVTLPEDIKYLQHAIETSTGNFVILHEWTDESGSSGRGWSGSVISELSGDGQTVIRRFIPQDRTQRLSDSPPHLSPDSVGDRVFVADAWNNRVIELDFDLNWKRILIDCLKTMEEEEKGMQRPWRLCYDEDKRQLIVAGFEEDVNVYTFSGKHSTHFLS